MRTVGSVDNFEKYLPPHRDSLESIVQCDPVKYKGSGRSIKVRKDGAIGKGEHRNQQCCAASHCKHVIAEQKLSCALANASC